VQEIILPNSSIRSKTESLQVELSDIG